MKRKKPKAVATQAKARQTVIRESRLDLLDRWLAWAFDTDGNLKKLSPEFSHLVQKTMRTGWAMPGEPPRRDPASGALAEFEMQQAAQRLDMLRWLQDKAKQALEFMAGGIGVGEQWIFPVQDLVAACPALTLFATRGIGGIAMHYEGNSKAIGLKAIEDLMRNPEARRIARCIEPGCRTIFIRRKAGRFCDLHGAGGARGRRHRDRLTAEQKSERRHRYYLNWLKAHDPSHYQHLMRRAKTREKTTA